MRTLRQTILAMANYYRMQISEDVLEMYAEDLADLDPVECIAAYGRWRRNPANKTFPLPAQIRELVNPEEFVSVEAQAREIASRIVGAVTSIGWCNGKAAQMYIGPIGWEAVQRQGGWNYLCENLGVSINPTTFQAQIRDQLEGSIRYGSDVLERKIHTIEKRESRKELERMSDIRGLFPKRPEPDGAA